MKVRKQVVEILLEYFLHSSDYHESLHVNADEIKNIKQPGNTNEVLFIQRIGHNDQNN